MKDIRLEVTECTREIARELEGKGLVTFIHHPPAAARQSLHKGFMRGDNFPATAHGFHSVTISHTEIMLSSHPPGQDEVVFLWEDETEVRPLYFVFAWSRRAEYERALERGELTARDYLAVVFPFNHPRWSSFIIWNGTVHCELTDVGHPGWAAPAFYVLEPLGLSVQRTQEDRCGIHLSLSA